MLAPQRTVGFAATNAGPWGRGDEHCTVGHAAMQARGVVTTYACPTVHGRVRSNECWPKGSRRRTPAPQCTVGFAATNPGPRGRGDERLPHSARSGSQQRMLARGVEATNTCPTVHGRVRSNECWPEGSRRRTPAPQCTVGFAATNAGPRGRGDQHCAVGFAAMQARGVEAMYACPTLHGRVHSDVCLAEGATNAKPSHHGRVAPA